MTAKAVPDASIARKKLRCRYVEANYDKHEASRGLFATAELLVC